MKLSEIKKKKIKWVIIKSCQGLSHTHLRFIYVKILEIIEGKSKYRSLPENRYYWSFIKWLEGNTPDWIVQQLGVKFNKEIWHTLLKAKFKIPSSAFDKMNEQDFNEYFNNCLVWVSSFIFGCDKKWIEKEIKNTMDE
jgi:hypothetical protein